jgi:hypothetical protein
MTHLVLCDRLHRRRDPDTGKPQSQVAEPGLQLCWPCLQRAKECLTLLPSLYNACEIALCVPLSRSIFERISGSRGTGLPLGEAAADARDAIRRVLASWASLVVDGRSITFAPRRAVPDVARFLGTHLDWLAAHPAAADFADEVNDLTAMARRAIEPGSARRIEPRRCIEPGCGGLLAHRGRVDGDVRRAEIHCDAGHVWRADEWLLLGHRIEGAAAAATAAAGTSPRGTRTVPTNAAALALGVPEATIRQWARRGKLTRHGSPGRAEYDVGELAALAELKR